MSVNGINNSPLLPNLGSLTRPDGSRANGTAQGGAQGTSQANQSARTLNTPALKTQAPIAGPSAAQTAVPAEAPPGTDPTLWSVLTNDERNFFAKTASLGPLTYGRIKAATNPVPPAARGVRLDVRA